MSEKKLIELHLHLDGSLSPETVWELSKEQGIAIPASSPEDVKFKMEVPEDCKTLEEYLERFALPLMVLQRADAIERLTFELVEYLAKEGVTYAEIRFAPVSYTHLDVYKRQSFQRRRKRFLISV